ncbi:G protein alpha subunit [Xylaria flabelliformis]|nr:G protein alpha subunit [Xylaria flabelliformis]
MCFGSRKTDEAGDARSRELDRVIKQDEKRMAKEVKLLLLGAGESGKSTVLKQMKLIYAQGFSKTEKLEWKPVVLINVIQSLRLIFDAMEDYAIEFEREENEVSPIQASSSSSSSSSYCHHCVTLCVRWRFLYDFHQKNGFLVLVDVEIGPNDPLPQNYLQPIKSLWADAGVQKAILKGNEYALHDNIAYFIDDVDRLWDKNYVPTDQDLLRTRLRTTGITETVFDLGQLTYRMFDVGGQRSERKKWIHCFENVTCLLFLVAISGYDQCLVEDKDGNQMNEALMLWESIANSHWFAKSALILFLNKMDLFREKLVSSPITSYGFTDYRGPPDDHKQASKYFMDKFKALNRNPEKEIYGHFTNATDTNLLKITMTSVQDMIIQRNLKQLIL